MADWYKLLRYSLFALNVLYFAMGLAVLSFGLFLLTDKTVNKYAFTDDMKASLASTGIGIVAVGGYVMLTSMFGLCGTYSANRCLLVLVFILLFPLSIGFNIGGGYLLDEYSKLEKDLVDDVITFAFELGVDNYYDSDGVIREAMDMLQKDLGCCGATTGIMDFPASRRDEVACSHPDEPCVDKFQDFLYTSIEATIACLFVIGIMAITIMSEFEPNYIDGNNPVIEQVGSIYFCCLVGNKRRQVTFEN